MRGFMMWSDSSFETIYGIDKKLKSGVIGYDIDNNEHIISRWG